MGLTTQQLTEFLDRHGIPSDAYSFYTDKDDAFCLKKDGEMWLVYYSERGHKNDLAWGKNEAQALNVMKLLLLEAFGRLK